MAFEDDVLPGGCSQRQDMGPTGPGIGEHDVGALALRIAGLFAKRLCAFVLRVVGVPLHMRHPLMKFVLGCNHEP